MAKKLIVVESPAKARTLAKYLGREFKALASYGHVRDLLPKTGAVDVDKGFAMHYSVIEKNKKHVDAIAREVANADALYLATDPDREGEAISWHLREILKERNVLDSIPVHRVVFYEVTKPAIREAIDHPRELSPNLIDAQQARRALDYLVGFSLSPLLWKKVRRGLSAGRVQSPALRLIVEREEEIERFKRREYWTVESDLRSGGQAFSARLTYFEGEKLTQFSITDAERASAVERELAAAAGGRLVVKNVEKKQRRRNPAPPFTTSTLQQEASRKLGFGAQQTMRIAQQLYEGVEIDGESVGLISYMRTDAVNLASIAVEEIRALIAARYGAANVPETPRVFKNRSKNAQEAHEAIRPTAVARTPDSVHDALQPQQYRLYELIWKRTVASQMRHATIDTVGVDLAAGERHTFRATGATVVDPGFISVYEEGSDDKGKEDAAEMRLPPLQKGQEVALEKIRPEQHFTEPPPRYSEASLVKALEAYGIGRPSTYANIITTLVNREYVILENKRFFPTDVGRVVNRFLTNHFARYVDYDFTANMEDDLDAISRGEKEWVPLMREFWDGFKRLLDEKEKSVSRDEAAQARELGIDPKSGNVVTVRMGRYGPFAQLGSKDDAEKPKFAGLRPGQKLDTITLEEALALFQLPRALGETEDGEPVSVNIGRFGPYVKYGDKFVSLGDEDPYTVGLARALEIVREKRERDANKVIQVFEGTDIQVLNGRYGPYITDGKHNARIPKSSDPARLTREECERLLAEAIAKKRNRTAPGAGRRSKKTATKKPAARPKPSAGA